MSRAVKARIFDDLHVNKSLSIALNVDQPFFESFFSCLATGVFKLQGSKDIAALRLWVLSARLECEIQDVVHGQAEQSRAKLKSIQERLSYVLKEYKKYAAPDFAPSRYLLSLDMHLKSSPQAARGHKITRQDPWAQQHPLYNPDVYHDGRNTPIPRFILESSSDREHRSSASESRFAFATLLSTQTSKSPGHSKHIESSNLEGNLTPPDKFSDIRNKRKSMHPKPSHKSLELDHDATPPPAKKIRTLDGVFSQHHKSSQSDDRPARLRAKHRVKCQLCRRTDSECYVADRGTACLKCQHDKKGCIRDEDISIPNPRQHSRPGALLGSGPGKSPTRPTFVRALSDEGSGSLRLPPIRTTSLRAATWSDLPTPLEVPLTPSSAQRDSSESSRLRHPSLKQNEAKLDRSSWSRLLHTPSGESPQESHFHPPPPPFRAPRYSKPLSPNSIYYEPHSPKSRLQSPYYDESQGAGDHAQGHSLHPQGNGLASDLSHPEDEGARLSAGSRQRGQEKEHGDNFSPSPCVIDCNIPSATDAQSPGSESSRDIPSINEHTSMERRHKTPEDIRQTDDRTTNVNRQHAFELARDRGILSPTPSYNLHEPSGSDTVLGAVQRQLEGLSRTITQELSSRFSAFSAQLSEDLHTELNELLDQVSQDVHSQVSAQSRAFADDIHSHISAVSTSFNRDFHALKMQLDGIQGADEQRRLEHRILREDLAYVRSQLGGQSSSSPNLSRRHSIGSFVTPTHSVLLD